MSAWRVHLYTAVGGSRFCTAVPALPGPVTRITHVHSSGKIKTFYKTWAFSAVYSQQIHNILCFQHRDRKFDIIDINQIWLHLTNQWANSEHTHARRGQAVRPNRGQVTSRSLLWNMSRLMCFFRKKGPKCLPNVVQHWALIPSYREPLFEVIAATYIFNKLCEWLMGVSY